jgi:hypothetical protein
MLGDERFLLGDGRDIPGLEHTYLIAYLAAPARAAAD